MLTRFRRECLVTENLRLGQLLPRGVSFTPPQMFSVNCRRNRMLIPAAAPQVSHRHAAPSTSP
jgi:hypothetical protein